MSRLSLRALDASGANAGDALVFNGTDWVPGTASSGSGSGSVGVGTVLPDPTTVPDQLYVLKGTGGSLSAYANSVLSDLPWGLWEETETDGNILADSSGNGRDMAITGAPTFSQSGPGGNAVPAILWPDSSGATENYAITSASHSTSIATIEAWVYLTALPTNLTTVVGCASAYGAGTTDKVLSIDTAGNVLWYFLGGSSLTHITSSAPLALNTWHHIVGSIGPDGAKIRVDKTTVATSTDTAGQAAVMSTLIHGAGNTANGGNQTNGSPVTIAVPAFYTSQLSDARTDAHYDAMTSVAPPKLYFSDGTGWFLFGTATAA